MGVNRPNDDSLPKSDRPKERTREGGRLLLGNEGNTAPKAPTDDGDGGEGKGKRGSWESDAKRSRTLFRSKMEHLGDLGDPCGGGGGLLFFSKAEEAKDSRNALSRLHSNKFAIRTFHCVGNVSSFSCITPGRHPAQPRLQRNGNWNGNFWAFGLHSKHPNPNPHMKHLFLLPRRRLDLTQSIKTAIFHRGIAVRGATDRVTY